MTDYRALATEIHASNIAAGWWPADPSQRNRGEVMMLIVSELAEAGEGADDEAMDDKLEHLRMFDVELADTAIRLFDLLGADMTPDTRFLGDLRADMQSSFRHMSSYESLFMLVRGVASAMEHHRKGRLFDYASDLADVLIGVYALADSRCVDLDAVIAEKRAYNAVRADHKIENRQAEGGKRY